MTVPLLLPAQDRPTGLPFKASSPVQQILDGRYADRLAALAADWDRDADLNIGVGFPYGFHLKDMAARLRAQTPELVIRGGRFPLQPTQEVTKS